MSSLNLPRVDPGDVHVLSVSGLQVQLLLQLEELVLLRRGLELVGPNVEGPRFEALDRRINKLRRRLPGRTLSHYDRLARQYPDVVTVIADGVCQGCQGEVSTQPAVVASRSNEILQCGHCGRFIVAQHDAPDYVA